MHTTRGVDPFFGFGESKENFTFFGALRAQRRNIKLCAGIAPRAGKLKIVYTMSCLVVFLC